MMKPVINKLTWLYTRIALYDEMVHVCVCLEEFVCGERYDINLAKLDFLSKYATKRTLSEVKIVADDDCLINLW